MRPRSWISLLLTAVLAAGCAGGSGRLAPADGPGPSGGSAAAEGTVPGGGRAAGPAGEAAATAPAGRAIPVEWPGFPVERVDDAVEHVVYESTLEIPGPGYYVVDLASGRAETWLLRGRAAADTYYQMSEDRRWIEIFGDERVFRVNRESGDTFAWRPTELSLRAAAPDRFLAGLSVVDGAGNVLHRIDLPEGDWLVTNPEWGASGQEVILRIYPRMGKGNLGDPLPLPTVVQ